MFDKFRLRRPDGHIESEVFAPAKPLIDFMLGNLIWISDVCDEAEAISSSPYRPQPGELQHYQHWDEAPIVLHAKSDVVDL
jgi:hypothetical protein